MRGDLSRLSSIVWKEFIQMKRDRLTFGMMLGVPVLQLLLFGYAIRMEVRNLATAVLDESRTQQSRALVQRFEATDNFVVSRHISRYEEALELIDRGTVRAAIVIPPNYARDLKRGRPTQVQVLIDAADPLASQSAVAAAQLVSQVTNLELVRRWGAAAGASGAGAGLTATGPGAGTDGGARPLFEARVRPLYNPALESSMFIVPGIIGIILSITMMIITSMALVRERERGTLEQLIVTPLTRTELMLGKVSPYVLVGYVQVTAVLFLGWLIFRVPIRGSLFQLYTVTFLFIVANLGVGLFISTLVKNQQQAMQMSYFFILPNILLSGFMFPREAMPHVAREIGLLFPLTFYLDILRGIVLKGVTVAELWPETLALAGFAVALFFFSVLRFRKRLE